MLLNVIIHARLPMRSSHGATGFGRMGFLFFVSTFG
jgi:hypothetical protein